MKRIAIIGGETHIGEINSSVTLRVSGAGPGAPPEVDQEFRSLPGGYAAHDQVEGAERDGGDWLITMQLEPGRRVHFRI